MDCERAREAISALIDEEPLATARADLDGHLERCPECRAWKDRAHEVTRRVRVASARSAPPASARLRAAVAARRTPPWRRERVLVRAGLVLVAVLQVAVTAPALILGSDHGAPIHVAHEMGSFDMALAIGFVIAAWRPSRARGTGTIVGAAALLLVGTAVVDLAAGRTSPSDELPHLLAVAGWLLLRRLAALTPSTGQDGSLSLRTLARSRDRFVIGRRLGEAGADGRRFVAETAVAERAGAVVDEPQRQRQRAASG